MDEKPWVGKIVHYMDRQQGTGLRGDFLFGVCRAAVITEVGPMEYPGEDPSADNVAHQTASLCVFNPTGWHWRSRVPHDETKRPGTWHFPERV